MIDSIVLYAGLVAALVGGASMIFRRTRRRGALMVVAGLVLIAVALAIPARLQHATSRQTHLDAAMPAWQFSERHSIEVNAPPDRVFQAIRGVTAKEIFLFRTLVAIRRFGRPGPESILNPPQDAPLLDVATKTSFHTIADAPPRELVLGTVVVPPRRALATMNFLVTPLASNRSRVETETRVFADSPAAARRFAVYWRVIHPGSDIIRRMWLRAVKRRAEGG